MILRIGAGDKPKLGELHLDTRSRAACGVDERYLWVVGDGRELPFRDRTFDGLVARHVIEHVSWRQVNALLREWRRVLRSGGALEITCPNIESYSRRMLESHNDPAKQRHMIRHMWGDQDYIWNFHHNGFTPGVLGLELRRAGFSEISEGVLPLYSIQDAQCKVTGRRS
jgi:predicted SAM-dependent methyltransferase